MRGYLILIFALSISAWAHADTKQKKEDWQKYLTIDQVQTQRAKPSLVRTQQMEQDRAELLKSIKGMGEKEFVTAIHQLQSLSSIEASALVKDQLSPDGSITTRDALDMMIITDQRDYVLNILESLIVLDRQAPEVQIEVKIIELMEGARRELGVNWSGSVSSNDENVSFDLNQSSDVALPPLGQTVAGSTLTALTKNSLDKLTMKISALLQEGKAKIMSEPKLLVANRHTGEFKMVDQIPWMARQKITYADDTESSTQNDLKVTKTTRDRDTSSTSTVTFPDNDDFGYLNGKQVSNNTATSNESDDDINSSDSDGTTSKSSAKQGVDYVWQEVILETGISLKVTPEIRQSGVISLDLNPVITELQEQSTKADRPILSMREIKTQAYVRDGDTLALGGLIYEKTESSEEGVPVLSKIPMLGRLFKTKKKRGVKTELLFLVRTRIVQL